MRTRSFFPDDSRFTKKKKHEHIASPTGSQKLRLWQDIHGTPQTCMDGVELSPQNPQISNEHIPNRLEKHHPPVQNAMFVFYFIKVTIMDVNQVEIFPIHIINDWRGCESNLWSLLKLILQLINLVLIWVQVSGNCSDNIFFAFSSLIW